MQRGGSPTCKDRMYASIMGSYAVDLLNEGKSNRLVAYKNGAFIDYAFLIPLSFYIFIITYFFNLSSVFYSSITTSKSAFLSTQILTSVSLK